MMLFWLSFTFIALPSFISAGTVTENGVCSRDNNRLQFGTYQFYTDCDSTTFCSAQGTCERRKCRRADFPFGFLKNDTRELPEKCEREQFCPDEEDGCQPLLEVGSACQLNRDDQCLGPPNFEALADHSTRGLNVNGSVCLHNVCMWANITIDQPCIVENTAYIAYGPEGEYNDIVSRGNCRLGLYCDSQNLKCFAEKNIGEACDADKECGTANCLSTGVCGDSLSDSTRIALWVYVVVGVGIVAGMVGTLIALFIFHRRQRDEEREKRVQYWREQNAFHQNLMQMREAARASILRSGSQSQRSTIYADDSTMPILQHAAPKPSGLRNYVDADESSSIEYDDGIMMPEPKNQKDNRF